MSREGGACHSVKEGDVSQSKERMFNLQRGVRFVWEGCVAHNKYETMQG
jgi:hypothetical protein